MNPKRMAQSDKPNERVEIQYICDHAGRPACVRLMAAANARCMPAKQHAHPSGHAQCGSKKALSVGCYFSRGYGYKQPRCVPVQSKKGQVRRQRVAQFQRMTRAGRCGWSEDSADGFWVGACGITWQFEDGRPKENGMKFCPKCGRKVKEGAGK
mgnify:CR=1 FL=1